MFAQCIHVISDIVKVHDSIKIKSMMSYLLNIVQPPFQTRKMVFYSTCLDI